LTKNGFDVIGEAENGKIAIERYKELNPDLVIMDITMPEMNGIEALRHIKKIDPDVIAIMLSSLGQPGFILDSLLAGASGFIVKPCESELLVKVITEAYKAPPAFDMELVKKIHAMYTIYSRDKNKYSIILPQDKIDELLACARVGSLGNNTAAITKLLEISFVSAEQSMEFIETNENKRLLLEMFGVLSAEKQKMVLEYTRNL
jgi:two-component system chemotaxis response regulator CheY